ncbi:BTAD domain-containing putative transcriptional regulator [Actinophytocola gossypii]|uniref:BTAD domain-containing putative transcriptional regulator n=1 Tax=Actinophytocola gossypii TaxID=2812003 RepID=UPI0021A7D2EA|nr:BTAD domain-containing putative transcriptional regulator [Actinophytocola gossypii]
MSDRGPARRTVAKAAGGLVGEFRRRAGLTQQELADVAGLSVAGVRDLEQGRVLRPRAGTVRRLVGVLGLSRVEAEELLRHGATGRAAGAGVRVEVLGPLRVLVDGAEVSVGSETQRLLLGLLALSPNVPVGRDVLIELGWSGQPPSTVGELLQSRMSRLRRRLRHPEGTGAAVQLAATAGRGYQLTVHDEHLDLLAFRREVGLARQARTAGDVAGACEYFARAVSLWRGRPLAGIGGLESHPAVAALVRDWQVVVVEYAEVAAELGRHEDVLPALRQVVESDPLNELAHARLIVALAGSGQQAAALTTFEDMRRRLAGDLGTDPGPELAEAFRRVLHQDVPRSEAAPVCAHQQLPLDVADFSGRADELRRISDYLASVTDERTAVPILSIEGMPGAGKTRLAVRVAHRLLAEGRYDEVRLHVDLCGRSEQPPADPSAVLASFLRLLGVPGSQIPRDLPSRAALYRDRLHGKRALVLLDNAASEAQIRPLLPASPTNLVLVTSRRTIAVDGGHTLPLDVFTPADGRELLSRIIGPDRVAGDPEGARRIVDLCGRLPLAIALAAHRLRARPAWRLADLVRRLAGTRDRLDELAGGGRRLRAVFDVSYRALDPDARRVFRLTGLHPGPDFTADSVAVLAGTEPAETGRILDRLVDERLVTVVTADRYRLHDLLAHYARHVGELDEPEPNRRAALTRLL